MNLGQTYTAAELPEGQSFEPLPAGWYTASITEAQLTPTKAGNGEYIKIRYDITGPSHEGRVVFGNLNIRNPNPKAEEIGHQQLGDLMRAIGLSTVSDTDQLIGGTCQIKLTVRKSEEYGDQNEVKAWKAIGSSSLPTTSATRSAPPPAQAPAPAGAGNGARPPWAKG